MSQTRVIIAGGGTGGHIFPAVAIGHAIQKMQPDAALLFVGANGRMEMEKVPREGFNIVGLDIIGFNRSNLFKNFLLPFKLLKSLSDAREILHQFKPTVVVGVGGYASFPVLKAAQSANIPTLIQEQNSFAGKSNRILAKKARAVCVAYDNMNRFFPKNKIVLTGNPVRPSIAHSRISRLDGLQKFELRPDLQTVLVIGGSLGAKSINEAIDLQLEILLAENVQVVWQTGEPYYQRAIARSHQFKNIQVFPFIQEMEYAFAAADVVVSRAGAIAIAEICIAARPAILVPYPFAAEDHQTSNALALVQHNAAEMVKDSDAKTDLIKKLKHLLKDKVAQSVMAQNLKKMAIRNADERIAAKVMELSKEKESA